MNTEELGNVSKTSTNVLIPEPLGHRETILSNGEIRRRFVDSLLAGGMKELDRLPEASFAFGEPILNEMGLESLSDEEMESVLLRLEDRGAL